MSIVVQNLGVKDVPEFSEYPKEKFPIGMEGGKCFLFQMIFALLFGGCEDEWESDGADETPGIRRFEYLSLSALGPNNFG